MENGGKKDQNDEEFRDLTKIGGQQPIFRTCRLYFDRTLTKGGSPLELLELPTPFGGTLKSTLESNGRLHCVRQGREQSPDNGPLSEEGISEG
jgi:hypothetical protein